MSTFIGHLGINKQNQRKKLEVSDTGLLFNNEY